MAIPFDCSRHSVHAARGILLEFIEAHSADRYLELDGTGQAYSAHVVFEGGPPTLRVLAFTIQDAFWQLLIEGIVAPGSDSHNANLPCFHLTEYGKKVLATKLPQPHDPDRYLERLDASTGGCDPTVRAYLAESLETFVRGNLVASAVTLGIAAERVFLMLGDSVSAALADASERAALSKLLERFPMKPKLDWILEKFAEAHVAKLFPDSAPIAIGAVFNMLRMQRNELGHPREAPPSVDRENQFANLQVFHTYYATMEKVRAILAMNPI